MFYPKIKTMLKTQVLTVALCCSSIYAVPEIFHPSPGKAVNVAIGDESVNAPVIKMNRHEKSFAAQYIKKNSEDLEKIRQRSSVPFSIIDSVLNHYGIPVELRYLAVIESDLKPEARSRVGAGGPWQLMPGTARLLGLKVSRHYDERSNYYKSTRAAAKYIRDLYSEFGDWLLVVAAYNGGPAPIYSAIRKSGTRNFWGLMSYLPAETRGHVKRYIATHYYFEGQGSLTTLTRSENIEYAKALKAYESRQLAAL